MGAVGLCALVLMLLGVPGRPDSPPSLCDPRVMERFILEARDAERGLAGCGPPCDLPEAVAVPDPGVNFNDWRRMDAGARAREVGGGRRCWWPPSCGRGSCCRTPACAPPSTGPTARPAAWPACCGGSPPRTPPLPPPPPGVHVRTLARLLGVHSSFLRGKVRLFLADACR